MIMSSHLRQLSQIPESNNFEFTGVTSVALPSSVSNPASLLAWLKDEANAIQAMAVRYGSLLFRDCPVDGPEEFEAVCRAVTPTLLDYTGGGSSRRRISGKVYNSTDYNAALPIIPHCEAAYFSDMPAFVWFYCDRPAAWGGETPVVDMAHVLKRLAPTLVERFSQLGVRYLYNLPEGHGLGRSWQAAFDTDDRAIVETWLTERGLRFAWRNDGTLHAEWDLPALRRHPMTDVMVWGNSVANWHAAGLPPLTRKAMRRAYRTETAFPVHALFGDGSPIPDADITAIIEILWQEERTFSWRKGDVMLCDNHRIGHGRRPFGGDRMIMVALA